MSVNFSLVKFFGSRRSRAARQAPRLQHRRRLVLEALEARLALTTFTVAAGDVSNTGDLSTDTGGLVWAINQANAAGGANTVSLASGSTYDFTTADNYWYGPNALPAISSNITVQGNGATLQRDSSLAPTTADAFRFFYVSGGLSGLASGNLTLNNLTLNNGLAKGGDSDAGGGGLGAGGAIFNQGDTILSGVTFSNNEALGGSSGVTTAGNGGGGMGQDAPADGDGGGFGGAFPGATAGAGGSGDSSNDRSNNSATGGGGGGGGFSENGADSTSYDGGAGGGLSGLGGAGGSAFGFTAPGGDGGGGGTDGTDDSGSPGGAFGLGGIANNDASAGGGGVGGGGGSGSGSVTPGSGVGGGGGFGGGGGATLGLFAVPQNIFPGSTQDLPSGGSGGFGAGNGAYAGSGGTSGDGMGGAVFSMYGTVTVVDSSLSGNIAQGGAGVAGGLRSLGTSGGNGYGGGMFNLDGTLTVINTTIDGSNFALPGLNFSQLPGGISSGNAVYNQAFGNNADGSTAYATANVDSVSNIVGGVVGSGTNAQTTTITGNQPTVTIHPAQSGPTTSSQIVFNVQFSEPVTGFSASGVQVFGSAIVNTFAKTVISGSGANYTVTISGMGDTGSVSASIAAGAAQDVAGNENQPSAQASVQFFDFSQQGNTVTILGTAGSDNFSVDVVPLATPPNGSAATTDLIVTLDGFTQTYATSPQQPITINYYAYYSDDNTSSDTSVVFGTLGTSQASFAPTSVQVSGIAYSINIAQSATNYVYGDGSTALFTGGAGGLGTAFGKAANNFVGTASYSYMTGEFLYDTDLSPTSPGGAELNLGFSEGYENFAVGFGTTYAYAYSPGDNVSLYSAHDAVVAMTPAYSYLSAGGATTFADGFSRVYAYSAGDGSDSAFMYDSATVATNTPGVTAAESATDVSFVAMPTYSYMSGKFSAGNVPSFFDVASGFSSVMAIAQGSGDVAYLDDPSQSGDVLLAFADGAAGMRDGSHEAIVQGFPLVYATGGSGNNELDVEGNTDDAPNLPGANVSPVSYSDGNELVQTGFDSASLILEGTEVDAVDFVLAQFAGWTG